MLSLDEENCRMLLRGHKRILCLCYQVETWKIVKVPFLPKLIFKIKAGSIQIIGAFWDMTNINLFLYWIRTYFIQSSHSDVVQKSIIPIFLCWKRHSWLLSHSPSPCTLSGEEKPINPEPNHFSHFPCFTASVWTLVISTVAVLLTGLPCLPTSIVILPTCTSSGTSLSIRVKVLTWAQSAFCSQVFPGLFL